MFNKKLKSDFKKFKKNLVECEKCGCLLKKDTAIQGESVIETEVLGTLFGGIRISTREKIREVFYCKSHAPRKKK